MSPPQSSGTEKKESQDRHHNQACRPSGKRSSISSHDLHPDNVLTVTGSLRISPSLKCHVWTAPAVQEESDISAKRSGAAMYPAFECSRYGRWPICAPPIGSQPKTRALSSRGTLRVFPIDGLDRFASMSSSPLQFVDTQTQPHPSIAELLVRLPRVGALGRARPWPATPKRSAPSCWPARPRRP